jgi:hypothetical protein
MERKAVMMALYGLIISGPVSRRRRDSLFFVLNVTLTLALTTASRFFR